MEKLQMKRLGKYLAILFVFALVFSAFPAQPASAGVGVAKDPNGGFVTGGGWIDSPAGAAAPLPAGQR